MIPHTGWSPLGWDCNTVPAKYQNKVCGGNSAPVFKLDRSKYSIQIPVLFLQEEEFSNRLYKTRRPSIIYSHCTAVDLLWLHAMSCTVRKSQQPHQQPVVFFSAWVYVSIAWLSLELCWTSPAFSSQHLCLYLQHRSSWCFCCCCCRENLQAKCRCAAHYKLETTYTRRDETNTDYR